MATKKNAQAAQPMATTTHRKPRKPRATTIETTEGTASVEPQATLKLVVTRSNQPSTDLDASGDSHADVAGIAVEEAPSIAELSAKLDTPKAAMATKPPGSPHFVLQAVYDMTKRDGGDEAKALAAMQRQVEAWEPAHRRAALKKAIGHFNGPTMNTAFYGHLKALFNEQPAVQTTSGRAAGGRTVVVVVAPGLATVEKTVSKLKDGTTYMPQFPVPFAAGTRVRITIEVVQ